MSKHSNVFYIKEPGGTFKPLKNATGVKNEIGGDLFRYKRRIYEASTGLCICREDELAAVFDNYNKEKFTKLVQESVEKHGLSPHYTQPEVKKDEVFPRDDSRKLAHTPYHKERCWFSRVYNENGIELYMMNKNKSGSPMMFAPCRDWMIGIGPSNQLEKVVGFLSQPDFDLHTHIENQHKTAMQNPEKWVDLGIAELLGRREEAEKHNQPIGEARDLARQKEIEAREAARLKQDAQKRADYETAIGSAEAAILEKKPVENCEINGKNLLLQLFRENGIELPLRTQGWVKTKLVEIHLKESGWSYSYRKNDSTVIFTYLKQLADVLEKRAILKDKPSVLGQLTANKPDGKKVDAPDKQKQPHDPEL